MHSSFLRRLSEVNRELWLILSLLVISAILNRLVAEHRMVLSFYALPTVFSAYLFGRRHAVLTAFASVFIVVLLAHFNTGLFSQTEPSDVSGLQQWFDIAIWGGILVVTAYAMGTLYEQNKVRMRELRETYNGVLLILRQFISKDKYTQNHSYRVSIYATKIAAAMGFDYERIEDVRAAALLHDIGKLDVPRDILYKAAKLTKEEYEEVQTHVERGVTLLEPVGGSLRRVLPIILAHHDRFDGLGYHPTRGNEIPLEARIISVADAFDAITSDRPYRKAMSAFEAKEIIVASAGKEFDPQVVEAFVTAFRRREMEVPELVV
jgi:putative nucleotidyltransferase with HDIG domain